MGERDEKYWYNLKTGQVERGYQSLGIDRAGPFDSAAEAARAVSRAYSKYTVGSV